MKKIAVCLSGCGFLDGAEIHESVLTLLAIDQAGAKAVCCAPDVNQVGVVDHLKKEPAAGTRNVLVESARIARGDIVDVKKIRAAEMDALIIPGGFGAAKNLCSFATDGGNAETGPGGGCCETGRGSPPILLVLLVGWLVFRRGTNS